MDTDLVSQKNFKYFSIYQSSRSLVLDGQTLKNLDILESADGTPQGTLLKYMDHCVTPFGTVESVSLLMNAQDTDCSESGYVIRS
jgi:DNA mismatch repair protein MSH6